MPDQEHPPLGGQDGELTYTDARHPGLRQPGNDRDEREDRGVAAEVPGAQMPDQQRRGNDAEPDRGAVTEHAQDAAADRRAPGRRRVENVEPARVERLDSLCWRRRRRVAGYPAFHAQIIPWRGGASKSWRSAISYPARRSSSWASALGSSVGHRCAWYSSATTSAGTRPKRGSPRIAHSEPSISTLSRSTSAR